MASLYAHASDKSECKSLNEPLYYLITHKMDVFYTNPKFLEELPTSIDECCGFTFNYPDCYYTGGGEKIKLDPAIASGLFLMRNKLQKYNSEMKKERKAKKNILKMYNSFIKSSQEKDKLRIEYAHHLERANKSKDNLINAFRKLGAE